MKNEYIDAVKPNEPENDYEMRIELTQNKSLYFTPKRLSHTESIEMEKQIKDLLERGIIRASNSEYASRAFLRDKKNKEKRLCVDYRELNKYTVKDRFPLPIIEDQILRLEGKNIFTSLDLKSGFHHMKIAKESVRYTIQLS